MTIQYFPYLHSWKIETCKSGSNFDALKCESWQFSSLNRFAKANTVRMDNACHTTAPDAARRQAKEPLHNIPNGPEVCSIDIAYSNKSNKKDHGRKEI